MFDHKHYVPIIPWKRGERIALRELLDSDREVIVPLIEISHDFVDKKPDFFETGRFVHSMLSEIASYWGDAPAFIDLHTLARLSSTSVARHIETFFHYSAEAGLKLCPVLKLQPPGSYQEVICKVIQSAQAMCLRLHVKDFEGDAITGRIDQVLSRVKLPPSSVHLLMDLQLINEESINSFALYEKLPHLSAWNTVAVAAGSFPPDLSHLQVGEHLVPRVEWQLWKRIAASRHTSRIPLFGDYAVLHPFVRPNFPGMNISASLRYTTDDYWVIMRGEGLRNEGGAGFDQYPANAELLMQRQEYCGAEFSYGDRYIFERPSKKENPGNPTTWIAAGVNHHITFVARQMAMLYAPSTETRPSDTRAVLDFQQQLLPLKPAEVPATPRRRR